MNKFIKIICLAFSLILVCLTLCSCNALDDMRNTHAYYKGDDIVFRGEVYKKLPSNYEPEHKIFISYNDGYYVTDEDVPVLLKSFGDEFSLVNGLISVYRYDDLYANSSYEYYCREDAYDYFCDTISSSTLDYFCYEYMEEDVYEYKIALIEEPVHSAIKNTLSSFESAEPISEYATYVATLDVTHLNSFYYCDHKMMLQQEAFQILLERGISADNDKYRIRFNEYVYAIPEEYEETIADFMNSLQ